MVIHGGSLMVVNSGLFFCGLSLNPQRARKYKEVQMVRRFCRTISTNDRIQCMWLTAVNVGGA